MNAPHIQTNSDGSIYVPDAQAPVNETHYRVDRLLKGYDPDLELMFIPPGSRGALDIKPWAVVHRPRNGKPYYVGFYDDADERLLARILMADNAKRDVLSEMDAMNKARDAIKKLEEQDAIRESHAQAAAIFRSNKYHYRHDGVDFGAAG